MKCCKSNVWSPPVVCCRKWKPGQPDDWGHGHEMGEDCAGLIHEGLWNDFFCEDLISYICEKEIETCKFIFLSKFHCIFPQRCPNVMFLCSRIAWIVATSWKGACSEQLDFPHVALVHQHSTWRVRTERAKRQFWNEPRAAAVNASLMLKRAFLLQSEPSPTLPASAIQQGNHSRRTLFFKVPNWLNI